MKKIYPKMEKADLILFGTPNYWYGPTGKMKLLIDRMRPFVANKKLKGKKMGDCLAIRRRAKFLQTPGRNAPPVM